MILRSYTCTFKVNKDVRNQKVGKNAHVGGGGGVEGVGVDFSYSLLHFMK